MFVSPVKARGMESGEAFKWNRESAFSSVVDAPS
jgi:hypothetical protein